MNEEDFPEDVTLGNAPTLATAAEQSELAALRREVAAWRALAELPSRRYDVFFPGRRTAGDFAGSVGDRTKRVIDEYGAVYVPRVLGEGETPGAAAVALAEQLGLLPKETL